MLILKKGFVIFLLIRRVMIVRKEYSEPVAELRKYHITQDIFTDSNDDGGDLHDDDTYDYFGN